VQSLLTSDGCEVAPKKGKKENANKGKKRTKKEKKEKNLIWNDRGASENNAGKKGAQGTI